MHMAQLMTLPLTVSCFSKIQIGFTFLVPAHPGSPGKRAVKWVCVCVHVCVLSWLAVLFSKSVSLVFFFLFMFFLMEVLLTVTAYNSTAAPPRSNFTIEH